MNDQLMSNGYTQVDPTIKRQSVYWTAIRGQCRAVIPPDLGQSCIASVESDLGTLFGARGYSWGDIYVIWQPINCGPGAWQRWEKKWSKRTTPAIDQAA